MLGSKGRSVGFLAKAPISRSCLKSNLGVWSALLIINEVRILMSANQKAIDTEISSHLEAGG